MPESPPEQVRTASPPLARGRARGSARTRASSSSSWGSRTQAAPASSTSARKTRWSPATAPVWAAAAAAPAPGFAHLQHRDADSPLGAQRERLGEPARRRRPPRGTARSSGPPPCAQTAASQSLASSTVWLPVGDAAVWKPIPRREPIALTARFPLWVIIATGPGRSCGTESPQSGARGAHRDDPVAVRAAERDPARRRPRQLALQRAPARRPRRSRRRSRSRRRNRARPPRRSTRRPWRRVSRRRPRRPAPAGPSRWHAVPAVHLVPASG